MKKIILCCVFFVVSAASLMAKDFISFDAGFLYGYNKSSCEEKYYDFKRDQEVTFTADDNDETTLDLSIGCEYFHTFNDGKIGAGLKLGVDYGSLDLNTRFYDASLTTCSFAAAPCAGLQLAEEKCDLRVSLYPVSLRYGFSFEGFSENVKADEAFPDVSFLRLGTGTAVNWLWGKGFFRKGFVTGFNYEWYNKVTSDREFSQLKAMWKGFSVFAAFRMTYTIK